MSPEMGSFENCRTPADFYRLQIQLENECTPKEIFAYAERKSTLPLPAAKWAQRMETSLLRIGGTIEPFRRNQLSENVFLFHGEPGESTRFLLVCFTGNFQRLTIPLPLFLQCLPAARFDVVVLRDPAKRFFLQGVRGYVEDIRDLPQRLGQDISISDYAAIRCLGTSAGGAAALAGGVVLGADRAMAFGGGHPSRVADELAEFGLNGREFDTLFSVDAVSASCLRCYYGAGHPADHEMARQLCTAFHGVRAVPMPSVRTHSVFFELFEQDQLKGFLERILLGEMNALDGEEQHDAFRSERSHLFTSIPGAGRLRSAWRRFGGWEQAVFWGGRLLRLPFACCRGDKGRNLSD